MNHGSEHPDVATSQNHVGRIYHKQADNKEALKFLTKAQKTREYYFGESDLRTSEVYSNIGDCLLATGDGIKALEFFNKCLAARQNNLSSEEDTEGLLGHALRRIASSHFSDFKRAIESYQHAIEAFRLKFEPQEFICLDTQHMLAKALHSFGKYEEACTLYKTLLRTFQSQRNDEKAVDILEDLGLLYQETGEYKRAKRTFLQVTEMRGD